MASLSCKFRVCLYVTLAGCILSLCFYTKIIESFNMEEIGINSKEERLQPLKLIDSKTILQHMSALAKILHRAKIHVRGTKTADHLSRMDKIVDEIIKAYGEDTENIVTRKVNEPVSVCPEIYMGPLFDKPHHNKGFEPTNCTHAKPLSQLVTVVAYVEDSNSDTVRKLSTELAESVRVMENVTTIIATSYGINHLKPFTENVTLISLNASSSGEYWNKLILEVETPYVLIARDVNILTQDTRLERLVREIEMLQVPVAAGSVRYPNGHWGKGCHQSVHRNYTLRYLHGYDESLRDCLFCDYIEGPFVTSVDTLKSIPFDSFNIDSGMFEDWFLQLNKKGLETVVCPDAMFHVRNTTKENGELNWKPVMDKWGLYKVMSPRGNTIISDCSNTGYWISKRALNPCRLTNNAYPVKIIMEMCEKKNITCELLEGTLLGGVKIGKVLPWEYDADIALLAANRTAFWSLRENFSKHNLMLKDIGAYYIVEYKSWTIDSWHTDTLDSAVLISEGKTPTKLLFDGRWSWTPRNPGLHARNRYGPEIYKHAVHWRSTGAKDWLQPYKVGSFESCDDPGMHDCLDRYNGDGDLQFLDPLP